MKTIPFEGGLMRRSRLGPVAAIVLGTLALATAAAGANSRATADTTFSYVSVSQIMVGWDPATAYSNEIVAMSNMYETLTRYDLATKTAKPLLATSFNSNKAGTVWTFKLRKGVTFHTGRPLTAQAAKAAIDRTRTINQGAAYIWAAVKTIDTPDQYTLVFHLNYPAPLDLNASADYAAYIYDTKASGSEGLGKWFAAGHDAGTGPYMVKSWQKGQEVELRQVEYPTYWGGWKGPHYTEVDYWVVPSVTTSAQLIRARKVSFVERLNPQLWASFASDSSIRTTASPSWQNLLALLNTKSGPLADVRVRQAVAYALDYNGIVAALKNSAHRQIGIVPPGLWGHFDNLPSPSYNPTKAKALLNQAGYGPGKKRLNLVLTHVQGDSDEDLVSTLIKSELAPLNINLQIESMQWPVQWAKGKSSNLAQRQDIFLFYWWPDYADPYSWFINIFHSAKQPYYNLSYYANAKVDAAMSLAERDAASKRAEAVSLYRQLQTTLLKDAPAIPLYVQQYQRTMLKSVSGFVDNPAYPNVTFVYGLKPTG
jgi:peptide/nickel transport system substrate-binding protein